MKYSVLVGCLFFLIYGSSCKKEDSQIKQEGFITAVASDSDVAVVGSLQLSDGNFVIVSRDYTESIPGRMVKLDATGKVLWDKRVSAATRVLWKTFLVPGIGFATFGYEDRLTSNQLKVCIYNNDGELLQTKSLNSGFSNSWKVPWDMLPLKNGDFAFAGGDMWNLQGHLIITDNVFTVKAIRAYTNLSIYQGFYIRGICEMANGDLMFTASTNQSNASGDTNKLRQIVLRTEPTGIKKTQTVIIDSVLSETPTCLANYKDGMLGVSSALTGDILTSTDGFLVNYFNDLIGSVITGRIQLNQFDSAGLLIGRKEIQGYPGTGLINAIKPTADGGFILCGTVNHAVSNNVVSYAKIFLLKLDANLNEQWSKVINTPYQSYGIDVLQTPDGGYLVSGHQRSLNKRTEPVVIKMDATGNIK